MTLNKLDDKQKNCAQQWLATMRADELIGWFVLSIYFCFMGQLAHFNSAQTASPEPLAKPLKTNLSLSNYENKDSAKARVHAENEKTS